MTRIQYKALHLVIVVVIIVAFVAMGFGWRDCSRRGGTYVRGLLWMECIR